MTTIGEAISRIRNTYKSVKEDAFITDRYIYSMIKKYAKLFMKRKDTENNLLKFESFFKTIPYMEVIEVDKIEADCVSLRSGCTIHRTKEKLPGVYESLKGAVIRRVMSIDGSQILQKTSPKHFVSIGNSTSFKYNTAKYYWYLNGYIYLANVKWKAVQVEALFEDNISDFLCDEEEMCKNRQENLLTVPDYLMAEIEQQVLSNISPRFQMPGERKDDKLNTGR